MKQDSLTSTTQSQNGSLNQDFRRKQRVLNATNEEFQHAQNWNASINSSFCDSPLYLSRIKSEFTAGVLESQNWTSQGVPFKNEPNTIEERNSCFKQIDNPNITKLADQLSSKNLSTYQEGLNQLNELLVWTDQIQERTMRFQFLEETARVLESLWKEEIIFDMVARILKDFSPHTQLISSTLLFLARVTDYVECSLQFSRISNEQEDSEQLFAQELKSFICSQKVLVELVQAVAQIDVERYSLAAILVGKVISYGLLNPKDVVNFDLHQFLAHGFFSAQGPSWEAMVNGIVGLIRNYPDLIKTEAVIVNGHLKIHFEDALCDDLITRITETFDPIYSLQIARVLAWNCSDETLNALADKLPLRLHQLFLQETNITLRQIIYSLFKKFVPLGIKLATKNRAVLSDMIDVSESIVVGAHDAHYLFYKQFGEKLRAQAFDFLLLCFLEKGFTEGSIKALLSAPDDTSLEFLKIMVAQDKPECLIEYEDLESHLLKKISRIHDINEAFRDVFAIEGSEIIDSNKVHLLFYLLKLLIDTRGVFPLNFSSANLIALFLGEYMESLEQKNSSVISLKLQGVSRIMSSLGVVVKETIEWLAQESASSESIDSLKQMMGKSALKLAAFKNKMRLLRMVFQEEGEEEKIDNQPIIAKCMVERTDIDYEEEQVPQRVIKFSANQMFPDFALHVATLLQLQVAKHLQEGEVLEMSILFINAGEKLLVNDQVSYNEMLSTIIAEADFTADYRCTLHILYSLEEDYNSIKIHCMECGSEQNGSREDIHNKLWSCEKCGETENYRVKLQ